LERITLASASPRRQDFFRLLGLPFDCEPADVDETPEPGLTPRQVAEDLALKKALAVAGRAVANRWIFGADTVVALDGEIRGKPGDRDEARRTLELLSGRWHEVTTAIALHDRLSGKTDRRSATCEVEFAQLSPDEIEWYLDTGEWQGAAGAYRLQERGACLIKSIKGSPSAVAGLPLREFYVVLRENGYRFGA